MKFTFYVVFGKTPSGKPKQRICNRQVALYKGEVAVKMIVDVPDAHFRMVIDPPIKIEIAPPHSDAIGVAVPEILEAP